MELIVVGEGLVPLRSLNQGKLLLLARPQNAYFKTPLAHYLSSDQRRFF